MDTNDNGIIINKHGDTRHPNPASSSQVELVVNAVNQLTLQLQRERLGQSLSPEMFDGKRKIDESLGYPKVLRYKDFYNIYRRDRLVKRLNNLPVNESWRKPPIIIDGDARTRFTKEEHERLGGEPPEDTEFIAGLKQIIKTRHLWKYLRRADKLSGIGQYGVLLIGSRSATPNPTGQTVLSQPVMPNSLKGPEDIIFLRVLTEDLAKIDSKDFDKNTASERFGLPMWYRVDFGEGIGQQPVHHSRIIHIAEELEENELFGIPRLEDGYNMALALRMIWGAGSEAVWRSAFKKIAAAIDADVDFDTDAQDKFEEQLESLIHGLKQWIYAQGVEKFETIGGDIVDVKGIFDVLISLISGDIPKHILLGTAQGQLASAQQDSKNWSNFINHRRTTFCEPVILRPLIDRFIEYGVLSPPDEDDYQITWESNFELDDKQIAEIGKLDAEARGIEWEKAEIPITTRWKEARGEDALGQLKGDYEDSLEFLPPESRNFEPGVAQ